MTTPAAPGARSPGAANYAANTAVTWPGRLRQIRSFFHDRSLPHAGYRRALDQPWLPPRYEQNFWNAA